MEKEYYNCLSYNLRLCRKQRGLTQKELACQLGVSHASISLWENGSRFPNRAMIAKIAALFRVPIASLTGETSEEAPIYAVTDEEKLLLIQYRKATDEAKNAVCDLLSMNKS